MNQDGTSMPVYLPVTWCLSLLQEARESTRSEIKTFISDVRRSLIRDSTTDARAEHSYILQSRISMLHKDLEMTDLVQYMAQVDPKRRRLLKTADDMDRLAKYQDHAKECRKRITKTSEWNDHFLSFIEGHRTNQLPKGFLQALVKAGILPMAVPAADHITSWIQLNPTREEARKDIVAVWYAETTREKVAEYLRVLQAG
jgi:hypothetical protein